MGWKARLTRYLHDLEMQAERRRLRRPDGEILVVPYRGIGNATRGRIDGRVLFDRPLLQVDTESAFRNLVNAWRRFDSKEVSGALVRLRYGDAVAETHSDHEGYFSFEIATDPLNSETWHRGELHLVEPAAGGPFEAEMLVPSPDARFAIISDVDDTVIETGAFRKFTMARNVLMRSAKGRVAFRGVAALYRALCGGTQDRPVNPLCFVSSGPWNLYDLLEELFELQRIPKAPIFLQDFGIEENQLIHREHDTHKREWIDRVFETWPSLQFVLIGDSGQHDPEIYRAVIEDHPGRVAAIYIRDVRFGARDADLRRLAAEAEERGVPMVSASETMPMALDAVERGLIEPAALEAIRLEAEGGSASGRVQ